MLKIDSKERPDILQVLNHPSIRNNLANLQRPLNKEERAELLRNYMLNTVNGEMGDFEMPVELSKSQPPIQPPQISATPPAPQQITNPPFISTGQAKTIMSESVFNNLQQGEQISDFFSYSKNSAETLNRKISDKSNENDFFKLSTDPQMNSQSSKQAPLSSISPPPSISSINQGFYRQQNQPQPNVQPVSQAPLNSNIKQNQQPLNQHSSQPNLTSPAQSTFQTSVSSTQNTPPLTQHSSQPKLTTPENVVKPNYQFENAPKNYSAPKHHNFVGLPQTLLEKISVDSKSRPQGLLDPSIPIKLPYNQTNIKQQTMPDTSFSSQSSNPVQNLPSQPIKSPAPVNTPTQNIQQIVFAPQQINSNQPSSNHQTTLPEKSFQKKNTGTAKVEVPQNSNAGPSKTSLFVNSPINVSTRFEIVEAGFINQNQKSDQSKIKPFQLFDPAPAITPQQPKESPSATNFQNFNQKPISDQRILNSLNQKPIDPSFNKTPSGNFASGGSPPNSPMQFSSARNAEPEYKYIVLNGTLSKVPITQDLASFYTSANNLSTQGKDPKAKT